MDYANYLLLPAQPISTTLISARIECTPHVLNCSSHSENECWVFFFIRFTRRYSRKNKINGKPIVKIRLHFSSCEWAPHIGGESIKCRQRIYAFFPLAIPRIDEYKRNQVSQSTAHPLLPPPPPHTWQYCVLTSKPTENWRHHRLGAKGWFLTVSECFAAFLQGMWVRIWDKKRIGSHLFPYFVHNACIFSENQHFCTIRQFPYFFHIRTNKDSFLMLDAAVFHTHSDKNGFRRE